MDELIKIFHIDYKYLIAQVINFGIVFFVLWFLALKPLMKIMQERTNTIQKSLEDSKRIEEKLANTEKDCRKELERAKEESTKILMSSQQEVQTQRKNLLAKTKLDIEKLVIEAKNQINEEKNNMVISAHNELAQMITLSLEKILGKTMGKEIDKKIIEKSIKDIKM